jgi:anti-sigma factor RsiW
MNCKVVEKHSIAYLNGSIDPRSRREMEAHLAECAGCRQRASEFRQIWGILDEVPAIRPSAGFDAAVRTRIAQEGSRQGLWGWLIAPSPRLAVAVTALLVCSVWLSSLPPAGRAPAPVVASADAEFRMIADLPVLEDYDVLAEFEALSELSVQPVPVPQAQPVIEER